MENVVHRDTTVLVALMNGLHPLESRAQPLLRNPGSLTGPLKGQAENVAFAKRLNTLVIDALYGYAIL